MRKCPACGGQVTGDRTTIVYHMSNHDKGRIESNPDYQAQVAQDAADQTPPDTNN